MTRLKEEDVKACIEKIEHFLKVISTQQYQWEKGEAQKAVRFLKKLLDLQSKFFKSYVIKMEKNHEKAEEIIPLCGGKSASLYGS
jgi:hypothetical protein